MSYNQLLLNIYSKYIIEKVFSYLQLNLFYKIIKYNKNFQQKIDINLKESIFDNLYNININIKTKGDLISNIEEMKNQLNYQKEDFSNLTFSAQFCFKYSYHFPEKLNLNDIGNKNIFLIKYKGFKINEYPLPSNFDSLNIEDKMKILEENKYFFEYTLNNKNIEIIDLINKFREIII